MTQPHNPETHAPPNNNEAVNAEWYKFLSGGEPLFTHAHHLFGIIPANPRCKMCNAPFQGVGGGLMRLLGKRPSSKNPRFCDACDKFIAQNPGGAEIELTMLFADARGSTALAETMAPVEFGRLMNRFYDATTEALIKGDALIDKFVGDEVIGFFIPGFAGLDHARDAIEAARAMLIATGHGQAEKPWLPLGIGIHTGVAYVGSVSGASGSAADFTALGDNVNITARLASKAGAGEALISAATYAAAGLDLGALEARQLELKGKSEPVAVRVLTVQGAQNSDLV